MAKKVETIKIYNSSQQMIPIQIREAGRSFFEEMQVRLLPKQHVELPKEYIIEDQITNLKSKGIIRVLFDSQDQ